MIRGVRNPPKAQTTHKAQDQLPAHDSEAWSSRLQSAPELYKLKKMACPELAFRKQLKMALGLSICLPCA